MRTFFSPFLLAVALSSSLLVSCKVTGDKDPEDTDEADVDTDTDTDADTDADTDTDTDTDTDVDTDTSECWIESESGTCYDCEPPTEPEDGSLKFLNQCTDAAYSGFDNASRIPASTWVPGTDLPTIE
jgi:hypothetical protein